MGGNGTWRHGGSLKPTNLGKCFARKNSEPFVSRNLSTNEKCLDGLSVEQNMNGGNLCHESSEMVGKLHFLIIYVIRLV